MEGRPKNSQAFWIAGLCMSYFSHVARWNSSEIVLLHVTNSSLQSILERTGYTLDVTTGQRKYGGPPPGWDGPTPGNGCEVSSACFYCIQLQMFGKCCTFVTRQFPNSTLNIAPR